MNAGNIVAKLKEYAALKEVLACSLHKRCQSQYDCSEPQTTMLYNFDAVKDKYCAENHLSPLKSADAVTCCGEKIVFVEFKSWKSYLEHGRTLETADIAQKATEYATIRKLIDSVIVAKDITNSTLFDHSENVVYVIATDIENNQMNRIVSNIYNLAAISTKLGTVCRKLLDEKLKENFKDLDYKYKHICCWELDEVLAGIG